MKPFLKWAGGKRSLLPAITPLLPTSLRGWTYVEPFVGGGAVFWEAATRNPSEVILADANADLMNVWIAVRDHVEDLITTLTAWQDRYLSSTAEVRAQQYQALRNQTAGSGAWSAARFLFLNKTGYNGLYRVNRAGKFNVPHGRYANPTLVAPEELRAASRALQGTRLLCCPVEELLSVGSSHSRFIFFDPPYLPLKKDSFTAYTPHRFGLPEHTQLRDTVLDLTDRGVHWVLCNSECDATHALYDGQPGIVVKPVFVCRNINSDAGGRGPVAELLIYPEYLGGG